MPAKTPIYLKAGNSKKGKKFKLRDILSPDMISPPLGDLRHTIHIGQEGQQDVFGDISFLQGNYELLPGNESTSSDGYSGGSSELSRADSTRESLLSDSPFSVLKNAISLPAIGGSQALTLPLSPVTFPSKQGKQSCMQHESGTLYYDSSSVKSHSPISTNGQVSCSSGLSEQYDWQTDNLFKGAHLSCELIESGGESEDSLADLTSSLLSMHLDFGPSLLDEVLNVMDKHKL